MRQEATDRTGISDASSGMAPDALQNMTAKATALVEQAGIGQTELMVRTFAQGLRRVFKGLLGLTIKHQDRPRAVRLRGKWVTFDPRHWNAGMDATVNTGLGAGTRERDMLMIQMIQQLQEKLHGRPPRRRCLGLPFASSNCMAIEIHCVRTQLRRSLPRD